MGMAAEAIAKKMGKRSIVGFIMMNVFSSIVYAGHMCVSVALACLSPLLLTAHQALAHDQSVRACAIPCRDCKETCDPDSDTGCQGQMAGANGLAGSYNPSTGSGSSTVASTALLGHTLTLTAPMT